MLTDLSAAELELNRKLGPSIGRIVGCARLVIHEVLDEAGDAAMQLGVDIPSHFFN